MLTAAQQLSTPTISVCVLTARRPALLKRLLTAVIHQLKPGDELVVLDTDPITANAELVSALASPQIAYVAKPIHPFSFAVARNELLQWARRQLVVFIDDDAVPFSGWLEQVRQNCAQHIASGGVTVSNAELPQWWDPAINWCVGLSPPGLITGQPGFYPDTCNMAGRKEKWDRNPFNEVHPETEQLYASGREDADWWMERRREGENIITSYQQAVVHEVHPERITWKYVMGRARLDGESSWLRRPYYDTATAIPWDFAHICGVVADKIVKNPLRPRLWVNDYVWMNRQWGLLRAVWKSPLSTRPRHRVLVREVTKATAFQTKLRIGNAVFRVQKRLRHRNDFPPEVPRSIFVSADCLVGDSILMRPHIQALANTFPEAEIVVSARTPQLLKGLLENVKVMAQEDASRYAYSQIDSISAAFIPYFYGGDYKLWREHLSPVGSTFHCDVGFSGRRDYTYARRLIEKNLELHEHENLARLFRLWNLKSTVHPAPPPVTNGALQWLEHTRQLRGILSPFVVVQLGAGYASKEWPLDCWLPFLKDFYAGTQSPIVIIGTEAWAEAGDHIVSALTGDAPVVNMAGKTSLDQLLAIISTASYFIGGCSGPKHLAMDYRIPTFTLYSATEPERWGASRDHELHAYVTALPQKLTGMELHGLRDDHRPRLLKPGLVVEKALEHYRQVMRRG